MKRSFASRLALAAGLACAVAALPVVAQDADTPESILPPGFGDPPPPPPPSATPTPSAPTPSAVSGSVRAPARPADDLEETDEEEEIEPTYILPSVPIAPLGNVGPLTEDQGGLGEAAWGSADGRALMRLMRRLDAPLPSRWASILLRRALLTNAPAPAGASAPDWIAERAFLLLRMGEAEAARVLIQNVHASQYSPKLYDVAMQTALALGDPGALCPIAETALRTQQATGWLLARAMCAGLAGEPGTASASIEQARRTKLQGRRTIDLQLAEKVIGAGLNSRRSITIDWDGVNQLNTWRYGLASATNVTIPPALLATASPQMQAWRARAPFLGEDDRIAAGRRAAILGVLSSNALVELYALNWDRTDEAERGGTPAAQLRDAFAGENLDVRLDAMQALWDGGPEAERFAGLILTARAAAVLRIDEEAADRAPSLIASMLTAGYDTRAELWGPVVDADDEGWALLALGSPRPRVSVSAGRAQDYADSATPHAARLLIAGLAGLGRIGAEAANDLGAGVDFRFERVSAWGQLLDQAVAERQPGTVALLCAIGMQSASWEGVPPGHLYRIVSALRRVGLEPEARMIAAEAIART